MTRAVCVGDNCIDRYLPPIDRSFVGGNAVNVAVYLQQHGTATSYVGVVGDDDAGTRVLDALRQREIDTSQVQVLPGQTAYSDIRLGEHNDREFVTEYFGPKPSGFLSSAMIDTIAAHDLVHTTILGGTTDDLPRIKQAGSTRLSMDYSERFTPEFVDQTLAYVDIAFFSLPEERAAEAPAIAQRMSGAGRLIVVTMGAKGSLAYDGGGQARFQSAIPVHVVDTLGAGDAFIGTFLAHHLRGEALPTYLLIAAETASYACTHYGAWTQP